MSSRDDIKKVIAYIGCSFPNYHPILEGDVNAVDVMWDQLGDLEYDDLMIAVRAACMPGKKREFAPSSDEIRSTLAELQMRSAGVPSAGEAWAAVIGSFERMPGGNLAGGGHGPVLDQPIVQEAVRQMGGYSAIGADFFDSQMANRAHFLKLYQSLLEDVTSRQVQLPMVTKWIEQQKDKMLTSPTVESLPAGDQK